MPEITEVECKVSDTVPLWECPCRECWTLEMGVNDMLDIDESTDYATWRAERE